MHYWRHPLIHHPPYREEQSVKSGLIDVGQVQIQHSPGFDMPIRLVHFLPISKTFSKFFNRLDSTMWGTWKKSLPVERGITKELRQKNYWPCWPSRVRIGTEVMLGRVQVGIDMLGDRAFPTSADSTTKRTWRHKVSLFRDVKRGVSAYVGNFFQCVIVWFIVTEEI